MQEGKTTFIREFDEVLDSDTAVQVSQHLDRCLSCRREYRSISELHDNLKSLGKVQAPEYLNKLVQHRVSALKRDSLRTRLQNNVELRWSRVRTIDRTWYLTRALGTVMACVLFIAIASSMAPFLSVNASNPGQGRLVPTDYFSQVGLSVLSIFGMFPKQNIAVVPELETKSDAAMSDEYYRLFGESISQTGGDDSLFVLMDIDETGIPKTRSVLEYPEDEGLWSTFSEIILSARCRPATRNGKTVPSNLIFLFNTVSVYN